jgi:hypothetical protein
MRHSPNPVIFSGLFQGLKSRPVVESGHDRHP